MQKRKNIMDVSEKRMLTASEAEGYTGLGRNTLRHWAESIGAVRKIGTRVLFDKYVIDKAMDDAAAAAASTN